MLAILSAFFAAAAAKATQIETVIYQPCNPKPPLLCDTNQGSTYLRVSFAEDLSGTPNTEFSTPWTVVASNTVPDGTNIGLDSCSADACIPLTVPLNVEVSIVRAVVAYSLKKVASGIAYGFYVDTSPSSGQDNPNLVDPSLLLSNDTCKGIVADLNAPNVCYKTAPLMTRALIEDQLGPYPDEVFANATSWLTNTRSGNCRGVICYPCAANASAPSVPTLYTAYGFGPTCTLWQIQSNADQNNYELDVFVNITAADGSLTGASLFFTSLSDVGTTGSFESRLSYTRLARGWFEELTTTAASSERLNKLSAPLDGAGIMVCSVTPGQETFNQGFFYPWNTDIPNNVPTASGTNSTQSWFYLSKDAMANVLGKGCGQIGTVTNLAPKLSLVNLTDACANNLVQSGYCVPGYANTPFLNATSLTPAQVISALNLYALQASADDTVPQPPFLPPGWTPNSPPYYLRTLTSDSFQLVYQPSSFAAFDVEGTFVVQISNDIVLYGDASLKAVVDPVYSACTYSQLESSGYLQFRVCNRGTDPSATTFYLTVASCSSTVEFANTTNVSPPFAVAISDLAPGDCTYTDAYPIISLLPPQEATQTTTIGSRKFPVFGTCSYYVTDETNKTALFGSVAQPSTITCYTPLTPLRAAQILTVPDCTFWKANCPEAIWAWTLVIGVPVLTFILIIVIVVCVHLDRNARQEQEETHEKRE